MWNTPHAVSTLTHAQAVLRRGVGCKVLRQERNGSLARGVDILSDARGASRETPVCIQRRTRCITPAEVRPLGKSLGYTASEGVGLCLR